MVDHRPPNQELSDPAAGDGWFAERAHCYPLRVWFEDTDLSGMVYHANYLRWLERARSAMLRATGADQRAMWETGVGVYVVRHIDIHYRAPARLDDWLLVVSQLVRVRPVAVDIQQRVMRGETLLADARVDAVFVTPDGRPRRQPPAWLAAFRPLLVDPESDCVNGD